MACGEKLAYGYRRVAWWLQRKKGLPVNRKSGVTGDARTWVAGALASSARTKEERVGPRGSSRAESDLAVGHDQDLGGACRGLGLSGVRNRLLYAGDRGMESLASLSDRRRAGSGRAGGAESTSRRKP